MKIPTRNGLFLKLPTHDFAGVGRITRRAHIREQKALLQRFLNISASVDKIEKLLAYTGDDGMSLGGSGGDVTGGGGDGDLIERVASEFNQLQFYVTQCKRAPYLDKIGPVGKSFLCLVLFLLVPFSLLFPGVCDPIWFHW